MLKQREALLAQTDAEHLKQKQDDEQLFKLKQIPGSPFHVLEREGTFTLICGNNLLTTPFESEQLLEEYIQANYWNIITTLILLLIETMKNGANQPQQTSL